MKKDLSNLTDKMLSLLAEIPDNFALENAKLYLRRAINEVRNVQVKRNKRQLQEKVEIQRQMLSYNDAKNALAKIDELIEIEQKNLQKKEPESNNGFLLG